MENEVKLDPAVVKRLRESKSWTQEHLATAAGVSLRTIQRLEADGPASAESRLAIAAALGVPIENINLVQDAGTKAISTELHRIAIGTRWGYRGLLLGTLASAAGILGGSLLGGSSAGQTGSALGILGAFAGIVAAAIGVLSQRAFRQASNAGGGSLRPNSWHP
jgi:transcriptional regulator with XRE-family HTH domain